jgi:transcriptional regulator with XRE-family HTH domain
LAKGMTLRKFADAVGVSPTYLSGIENGTHDPPTLERLAKISEVLGLPLDEATEEAQRWDDVAKTRVEERSEFVRLLRAVKDLSTEQVDKVVEAAKRIADEPDL